MREHNKDADAPNGDGDNDTDNEWLNEDPNLLNVPELLYRATESLPLPEESNPNREAEILNTVKLIRELVLDHNIIFDMMSKREEIRCSDETALGVIKNLTEYFGSWELKILDEKVKLFSMPLWDEQTVQETFSNEGSDRILKWKATLNQFLECYSNIRKYISRDTFEQNSSTQNAEWEREQCKSLPNVVEELENFMGIVDKFMFQ